MKFELVKASDWDFKEEVEINSLEDLNLLVDKYACPIVYTPFLKLFTKMPQITIYDDYLE